MQGHYRRSRPHKAASAGLLLVLSLTVSPAVFPQSDSASAAPLDQQIAASLARGDRGHAADLLNQLLAEPRLASDLLERAGIAFAEKGLYSEASRAFERSVRDYPSLFEGYYNLALAELGLDRLPQALKVIEEAPHRSEEESTARLYLRGKIEASLGQMQSAGQDLAAAFEKAPGQENYALDLGLVDLRAHAYPQAERVFARGSDLNPQSPYLGLGLALAQFLGGRTSQSVESARRLLAAAPDFSPARLLLGFTLYFDGNLDGAREVAQEGLKRGTPDPYLYYLDAAILQKQHVREYARILADLSVAEKNIPGCALCYVASGRSHEEQSDLPAALSDFQKAVQFAPDLSEGWYHLASVSERMGKTTEAAQARAHFQQMKENLDEREKEIMRGVFLQSLGAQGSTGP